MSQIHVWFLDIGFATLLRRIPHGFGENKLTYSCKYITWTYFLPRQWEIVKSCEKNLVISTIKTFFFLPASFPKWDRTYSEEAWLLIFTSYHIYVLSRQQYALVHSYSVTLNARQIHSFFNYLSQNFWKSCNLWDCFWFALQNRQKYFFVKIFFVRTELQTNES